jgi:hypothetical protein
VTGLRAVSCALVVLVAVGCGSGDGTKARRDAVNRYLTDVQGAQIDLVGRQGEIDSTLQSFSLTRPSARDVRNLRSARTTIAATLRRVRALDTPPDARRLGKLLVRRLALQQALVDELIQTSRDVVRLAAAGPLLTAAAAQLRSDLAAIAAAPRPTTTVPPAGSRSVLQRYGEAFGGYGDTLRPIAPRLAPSHAASLLRPTLAAQQTALTRSVALCREIRGALALARPDIPKANASIHSLLTLAVSLNGAQTRKREAAAAGAYDARIAKLNTLASAIVAERERLVRRIG